MTLRPPRAAPDTLNLHHGSAARAAPQSMTTSNALKLLVLGIDGASATVLDDLIARDRLPNFKALRARAASGVLQSTFPPHTAPGWASMFTGVEPGEHGVYQFWSTQAGDYSARGMNVADYGREPVWRTLERHGYRVGVYNVPMTHPPAPLRDGYMVSWPLSKTLRYTEPPELMSELAAAGLHYHSDIVTMYRGQDDYVERASRFIDDRARTCLHLQQHRPVDALFVVFTEIDRVSHYYWGEDAHPGPDVERIYADVDRALGTLLELVDDDTLFVVASDHGFGRCDADFNVHELLEQHGLLATEFAPIGAGGQLANDDATQRAWFDSPFHYRRTVAWAQTRFYMPTPGCFGLNANLKGRDAHGTLDADTLPDAGRALADALATVVDAHGQPWFRLEKREHVYRGARLADAPDYLLIPRDFSVMPTPNLTGTIWSEPAQRGVHRPDGIVFVAGPAFPRGAALFARIEDIYPTLLAHLGLPVPDRLDGHWLVEPGGDVAREAAQQHAGGRRMTDAESAFMDSQLQQIGYF